ncbi:hypothetical protein [Paenibacillus glycanilyticus]|uniref:Nucleotidyltransferase family protein n=1 Tax=Paenibacillus glycanilyticus TaxID=126569 RepID=A0ABQ6GIX5_9BACL|nr:hypothetical protein [Paenibacillus glycanilyticus]GLX68992.1 hypothetical protein MU1_33370 [Paenibacillus glycanilyticus]
MNNNNSTSIDKALAAIVRALDGVEAAWVLGGSSGLLLRGLPLPEEPNDIDLYTDDADYDLLYERLTPYATDVKQLSECGNYRSVLSHFLVEGIPVELVGGFVVRANGCRYQTEVRSVLKPYSECFTLIDEGVSVPVVPLAHELWFNMLRGREDRLALIMNHYIKNVSLHEEARNTLEARNLLTVQAKKRMNEQLIYCQAGAAL